jgi:hypothetical protein
MKTLFVVTLLFVSSCGAIFNTEGYQRHRACVASIPVLREIPDQPYRTLKVFRSKSDAELVERACLEGADAVLILSLDDESRQRGAAIRWQR